MQRRVLKSPLTEIFLHPTVIDGISLVPTIVQQSPPITIKICLTRYKYNRIGTMILNTKHSK